MKKVLAVFASIGSFLVILIAMGIGKVGGRAIAEAITTPDKEKVLETAATQLNARLPMMVDAETRLDHTAPGADLTFNYFYTLVSYSSQTIRSDFVSALSPGITANACGAEGIRKMLMQGVTVVYNYRANDGVDIGKISVNQRDCSALASVRPEPADAPVVVSTQPEAELGPAPPPREMPRGPLPQAVATTGPSASDKVNYRDEHNGKCWEQYQAALAQIPSDASLGDAADFNAKAQRRLDRCVKRG